MNRNNMKIVRKERRRDRRRGLQIEARLDGHDIVLTDLSAAGFGAALDATDPRPADFRFGRRVALQLTPRGGQTYSFMVEITRPLGDNGVLGGVFVALSDEAFDVIESLIMGRDRRRR